MKIFKYIKKYGLLNTIDYIWKKDIGVLFSKIIIIFTKNKPLKDEIIIESHNDFDCNGGAIYNYLIKNHYNDKYKIIWLVRKKYNQKFPKNVILVPLNGPSVKRAYHMCVAKYLTFDCEIINKMRNDQKLVYCSHGAGGFKSVKGNMVIPKSVDYLLCLSPSYIHIQAEQWSLSVDDPRFVYIGYPCQDVFFNNSPNEFFKISTKKYNKVFLWMPTFRKGGGYNRNDSDKEQKLGIPLYESKKELLELNEYLKKDNNYLILKIHPKQDLSAFNLDDLSNMIVLTGDRVKELNIDNYNLIKSSDALISDYSGAAYDYLQLDRPIGYVLDDIKEYKIGFVVDDIHKLIAGEEIYTVKDLYKFIDDVSNNNDLYKERRKKIRDFIYSHHDGKSCERLIELLGMKKK